MQTCFNFHRCKIFHYYSTLLLHCSILLLFSIFCIWRKFIVGPFDSFIEKYWLYMRLTIWCSLAPVYLFFSLLMSAFGGKWKYLPFLLASQDFICALLQLCIIYNVWPPSALWKLLLFHKINCQVVAFLFTVIRTQFVMILEQSQHICHAEKV